MKEYIFIQYLQNICSHLGIESSDLFVKSREQRIVDARQLLYYLCVEKSNMGLTEITGYVNNQDFDEDQPNILRSVESFRQKVANDSDLKVIIRKVSDIKK